MVSDHFTYRLKPANNFQLLLTEWPYSTLLQIENEYGNIEWEFGDAGKRYVVWAANMAIALNTGVPWVMCQQGDAPGNIVRTSPN